MRDLPSGISGIFFGALLGIWRSFFHMLSGLIMAFVIISSTNVWAVPQPFLVKDINQVDTTGSSPQSLVEVNGIIYFSANDGIHGQELWKSDGTAAGTVLVKDIVPGSDPSDPQNLTNVNGTLFFIAYHPTYGTELWKSDGTAAGTVLVKNIVSGSGSSDPYNLTNINGTLYFVASDTDERNRAMEERRDSGWHGAGEGHCPGSDSSYPQNLTNVNGTLFFVAYDPTNGTELWKSDGTAAGTVLVKDIVTGSGRFISPKSHERQRDAVF